MTPPRQDDDADDAALGHVVRELTRRFWVHGLAAFLALGWLGREASHSFQGQQDVTLVEVSRQLSKLQNTALKIQFTQQAMLDNDPPGLRARIENEVTADLANVQTARGLDNP
jgi:hypothetical protein